MSLLDLGWALGRPLLFSLDAERAHRMILGSLGCTPRLQAAGMAALSRGPAATLACKLGPLEIPSPIGLAAGLDKDGEAIEVWPSLGFGFIEVGTVTAHPQPGNPAPRLFRLKAERGLINRMGFNNHGSEALAARLTALRTADRWPNIPVGVNIGKSKITPLDEAVGDYLMSIDRVRELADYLVVNVSSPNTPGLRELQRGDHLPRLLGAVVPAAGSCPLFVKFSPDLSDAELDQAVDAALAAGCTGIIATNTTNSRPGTTDRLGEPGGLSGAPLWPLARKKIGHVLARADGRIPVVGVGGISGPEQAAELLDAGCAAVQVYSAMIYEGPGLVGRINRGLVRSRCTGR
jgi:dihydroorotate dehydrogenase